MDIPVVAIGGINIENVRYLNDSKISGIAVISSIFDEENIKLATKNLKSEVLKILGGAKNT